MSKELNTVGQIIINNIIETTVVINFPKLTRQELLVLDDIYNLQILFISSFKAESYNQFFNILIQYDSSNVKLQNAISNQFTYKDSNNKTQFINNFYKSLVITFRYNQILFDQLDFINDTFTSIETLPGKTITVFFQTTNDMLPLVDNQGNFIFDQRILDIDIIEKTFDTVYNFY